MDMKIPPAPEPHPRVRRAIRIRGTVQGVGFRPTVHRLAIDLSLAGFVRNDSEGVWTEVEGAPEAVDLFVRRLQRELPPLARIDSIQSLPRPAAGDREFRIVASTFGGTASANLPADTAPCTDCLQELLDPSDRRYRYPFINCTVCGPRYTIVQDVPYDRVRTTMRAFEMCDDCRVEYEEPANRRFHAEPNACPRCGPRLQLLARNALALVGEEALISAIERLKSGEIVAVKGLGGFLLAADASREESVAQLRARKRRPDKPLAVMVRDLEWAERIAEIDQATQALLESHARPIVLAQKCRGSPLAAGVAPGLHEVGLFLPATPLQHLLLADGPPLQIMTSGNRVDEPIARTEAEAFERLEGIADAFLIHDRVIQTRVDDSVVRIVAGEARTLRRGRGYVPEPILLPFDAPPLLAVGAQMKNTVCVSRGAHAFVSQHLGDLSHAETFSFFEETILFMCHSLRVAPEAVACDLHPDYRSTSWAEASGLPQEAIQHHHAHIASCLAEYGEMGPALGVAFDGTGCGPDGSLWGGEILKADLVHFERLGHLYPLRLPGGEAAIHQPWRLAAAALLAAGEPLDILDRIPPRKLRFVRDLLSRQLASPLSSGAGRWFDAIAALCGVRDVVTYDAQAAIELEAACTDPDGSYALEALSPGDGRPFVLDPRPVIRAIAGDLRRGVPTGIIASNFHEAMAEAINRGCQIARDRTGLDTVALSGGCFQNRRLTERAQALLEHAGFRVLLNRRVPANDGGLSLGQVAIAGCRRSRGSERGARDDLRTRPPPG